MEEAEETVVNVELTPQQDESRPQQDDSSDVHALLENAMKQKRVEKQAMIDEERASDDGAIRGSSGHSLAALPLLEEPGDAAFLQASVDPVNLLDFGFAEGRDRSLGLQCLRRSISMLTTRDTSSFRETNLPVEALMNASVLGDSARNEQEFATGTAGSARYLTPADPAQNLPGDSQRMGAIAIAVNDPFQISSRKSSLRLSRQISQLGSPGLKISGTTMELPEEYYTSLSVAPHASLIHLVILYHQALVSHGLSEEAERIAALLKGLQVAEQSELDVELKGMDLLLKDGLLKLYSRIHPFLPPIPSQIVKFKSVTYTTKMMLMDGAYDTVFTKVLECVEGPFSKRKGPENVTVLKDATGYLMPGTLTLVLGPPGCGKSTLQSALAGQIPSNSSFEGSVTYNGQDVHQIQKQHLAAVVGQRDVHYSPLTVHETLEFARKCTLAFKSSHFGPELMEIMGDALKIGQDPKLEITLSMMGLKRVANRLVGSPLVPNLTEDERHRLTLAEMFVGAYAVFFLQQLNSVIEDAVTYDLANAIRVFARARQIAVMASLLQPSPEVFDLFDRVILLDQGHIVYQGPRQDALNYFEGIGYKKPRHLGVGEFLQEVTTNYGAVFLQPGFKKLCLEEFVAAYKISDMYKDICRVVDDPDLLQEVWVEGNPPLGLNFIESNQIGLTESASYLVSGVTEKGGSLLDVSMDHTSNVQPGDEIVAFGKSNGSLQYIKGGGPQGSYKSSLHSTLDNVSEPVRLQLERPFQKVKHFLTIQYNRDYILEWSSEVRFLINREMTVTWRNKFGLFLRLFQVLILSLFIGSLLFRVKNDPTQLDMNLLRTAFFVSLLNMTMFNVGQLPALLDERAIYYKQQGAHFFRPGSYLLAKFVGSLPFSLCEGTIWSLIVFFLIGLSVKDGGWHFFVYYIVVILTVLNGASMVRFFSVFAPDREKAGIAVGLFVSLFILFAGFLLPRFKVPKYWLWMYYIDPLQWGITALMVNEYNSASYNLLCKDVPNIADLPQCIGRPNNTIGHAYLAKGQFYTSNHWISVAVGVLLMWILLWNVLTYFALAKLRHVEVLKARKLSQTEKVMNAMEIQEEEDIEDEVKDASKKLSHTAPSVTLSWHELGYDVMIPSIGQPRTILSYVSGWGEPGDLVAIIGSGGAGKTTLLNCLAGRKILPDRISGQILVNGYAKKQKSFATFMGYADLIDAYTPYMTVRENVAFSAAMRLGKASTSQRQANFVEEVLELLELKHIENVLVMSLTDGVTLEQEKRLAIATELAANPSVLFIDDPTKGLDSLSAFHIVECLKHIAETGRLVIATFKYPSQRIITNFTKAQILKRGGETVYFGPVGKDGEMVQAYFEAIPGTPLCPPNKSICSFAVDVIGDGVACRKALKDYAFEYRVSELALRNHVHLQHLRRSKGQNGPELSSQGYGATYTSMALQVIVKLQRQYWRNVSYSWGRMIFYMIMSLLLGSVYFKMNYHTNAGMNSLAGSIFISLLLVGITNAQNAIPQVFRMRAIYTREKATNQHSVFLYNIAWTLAEIPYLMVANLIFCSIFLPMANMAVSSASQFFKFWFLSFEFYLVITFLGALLAVVCPVPQIASVMVPIIIGIWVSTGGLVIPKRKILRHFLWIFWTNPLQYALNGLTSVAFFCDINKTECLNNGLNPNCAKDPTQCPGCDCPRLHDFNNVFVWQQIQSSRSLNHSRIPYDMLALFSFFILLRFLTFTALKLLAYNKRT